MSTQITLDMIVQTLVRLDGLAHRGALCPQNEDVADALELFARLDQERAHPQTSVASIGTLIEADWARDERDGSQAPAQILAVLDLLAPRRCFVTGEVQEAGSEEHPTADEWYAVVTEVLAQDPVTEGHAAALRQLKYLQALRSGTVGRPTDGWDDIEPDAPAPKPSPFPSSEEWAAAVRALLYGGRSTRGEARKDLAEVLARHLGAL